MDLVTSLSRSVEARRKELSQARAALIDCESALTAAKDAAIAACSDAVKYRAAQRKVQSLEAEQKRLLTVIGQFTDTLASVERAHADAIREAELAAYAKRTADRRARLDCLCDEYLRLLGLLREEAATLDSIEAQAKADAENARRLGTVPVTINALHELYARALKQQPDCVAEGISVGYADTLPRGTVCDLTYRPSLVPGDASMNLAQRAMLGDIEASSQLAKSKPVKPHLVIVPAPSEPVAEPSEPTTAADEWRLIATHSVRLMRLDSEVNEFAQGSEKVLVLADQGSLEPGERITGGANIATWQGIEIAKLTTDTGRSFLYQPRSFNFEPSSPNGYKRVPCERIEALDLKAE